MALSTEERLLLRQVFRVAHAKGWSCVETDRLDRQWADQTDRGPNVNLLPRDYGDGYDLRVYVWEPAYRCVQVPLVTVREAVDILVALGLLPVTLSSVFGQGYRDGMADVTDMAVTDRVDALLEEMWDRLGSRDTRRDIGDAIGDVGQLLVDGDPWVRGEAADRVVETVCKVFDRPRPAVAQ